MTAFSRFLGLVIGLFQASNFTGTGPVFGQDILAQLAVNGPMGFLETGNRAWEFSLPIHFGNSMMIYFVTHYIILPGIYSGSTV